jgi:hypothetical protein
MTVLLKSTTGTIGTISSDENFTAFEFKYNDDYRGDMPFFIKIANDRNNIQSDDIKDWVCGRAPDSDYMLLGHLIDEIGIKEYDPIAFFKAFDGRMNSDEFYIENAER